MKTWMGFLSIAVLMLAALSACTLRASTEQTTDTTSNITASTSGHSWFTNDGLVKNDQKITAFAHLNFENLKQDMAAGHGEYLASLSSLMGITPDHQTDFFLLTQTHYTTLVRSEQTTPAEMLVVLNELLVPHTASVN